eukprot:scaffold21957_cov56-Phaeocystis_antarctica.AAC.3
MHLDGGVVGGVDLTATAAHQRPGHVGHASRAEGRARRTAVHACGRRTERFGLGIGQDKQGRSPAALERAPGTLVAVTRCGSTVARRARTRATKQLRRCTAAREPLTPRPPLRRPRVDCLPTRPHEARQCAAKEERRDGRCQAMKAEAEEAEEAEEAAAAAPTPRKVPRYSKAISSDLGLSW